MAILKDWEWGRQGVTLHDDHITWYEKETSVRFASGAASDQTFENFLELGPWVDSVPPDIVVELTKALDDHLAGRS